LSLAPLHLPVLSADRRRHVTGWLYTDGFALELTAVLEVARIAVVVSVTCAAAA